MRIYAYITRDVCEGVCVCVCEGVFVCVVNSDILDHKEKITLA